PSDALPLRREIRSWLPKSHSAAFFTAEVHSQTSSWADSERPLVPMLRLQANSCQGCSMGRVSSRTAPLADSDRQLAPTLRASSCPGCSPAVASHRILAAAGSYNRLRPTHSYRGLSTGAGCLQNLAAGSCEHHSQSMKRNRASSMGVAS